MSDVATLIPLDNVDPVLVEQLLDRAFEPGRHQRTAYKVREGCDWLRHYGNLPAPRLLTPPEKQIYPGHPDHPQTEENEWA